MSSHITVGVRLEIVNREEFEAELADIFAGIGVRSASDATASHTGLRLVHHTAQLAETDEDIERALSMATVKNPEPSNADAPGVEEVTSEGPPEEVTSEGPPEDETPEERDERVKEGMFAGLREANEKTVAREAAEPKADPVKRRRTKAQIAEDEADGVDDAFKRVAAANKEWSVDEIRAHIRKPKEQEQPVPEPDETPTSEEAWDPFAGTEVPAGAPESSDGEWKAPWG